MVGDKIEILDYNIRTDYLTFAGPVKYHTEKSYHIFKFFTLWKSAKAQGVPLNGHPAASPNTTITHTGSKKLEMFEKPKQVESVQQQKKNPYDTPTAIDLDHEDYDYHGQLTALINKGGT